MTATDEDADKVWQLTLKQVRNTRYKRELGRKTMALAAVAFLCFGSFLLIKSASNPTNHEALTDSMPLTEETFAVMKVDENGEASLVELSANKFCSIELTFGLTQLVCEDRDDMDEPYAGAGRPNSIFTEQLALSPWSGGP